MGFAMQNLGIIFKNLMMHIPIKNDRIAIQCHNKWDKMKIHIFKRRQQNLL